MQRIIPQGEELFLPDSPPVLLALLGDKRVWKSPSPKMHLSALKALGLRGYYVPLETDAQSLKTLLPALFDLGFLGINVTAPLKEKIIPHLAGISESAKDIGAVNTLVRGQSGYRGGNTDAPGFSAAYLTDLKPVPALVLGAGGAARAVIHALLAESLTPVLSARNPGKAEALANEFKIRTVPWDNIKEPYHVIVNASGASSLEDLDPPPKTLALRKPGSKVIDINYNRENNYFQELAIRHDVPFMDGLSMLAHQARLSLKSWIGSSARVPLAPFMEALGRGEGD